MKSRTARCPLPCRNGEESGRLRRRHPKKPDRIRSKYHVSCRKSLLPVNHGRQVLSFCSILRLTKKPGLPRNFRLECSADWDAGRYDGFRMNIKIACRLRSECWYRDFILPASASNFLSFLIYAADSTGIAVTGRWGTGGRVRPPRGAPAPGSPQSPGRPVPSSGQSEPSLAL